MEVMMRIMMVLGGVIILMFGERGKKGESPPIVQFKGYYSFLSIDYPCWVYYQGFMFPSVATAFQAARSSDALLRRRISQVKEQQQLKKIVSEIKNTGDWPHRRIKVMEQLNRDKFKRNKDLGLKLFATQKRRLVNGYPKGGDAETFWGAIHANNQFQGLNTLGQILTTVREDIHQGQDNNKWILDQNIELDPQLWPIVDIIAEKDDGTVDTWPLREKAMFLVGWGDHCHFQLPPSTSKYHASIYFSTDVQAVLVDLNSSQGTTIVRGSQQIKLQPLRPQSLQHKDVIVFGQSEGRYTLDINYEQVERRISERKEEARAELERIERIKEMEAREGERVGEQRNSIKHLLELKQFSCLYVEGINRNFSYKDIRETFNEYAPTKNIRINIDQKTGRFMGSVLVYYEERVKISDVLASIHQRPIKYDFRVVGVTAEEAEKIIATFTSKEAQQQRKQAQQNQKPREPPLRRKQLSSSSSSSYSRSRSPTRRDQPHNK